MKVNLNEQKDLLNERIKDYNYEIQKENSVLMNSKLYIIFIKKANSFNLDGKFKELKRKLIETNEINETNEHIKLFKDLNSEYVKIFENAKNTWNYYGLVLRNLDYNYSQFFLEKREDAYFNACKEVLNNVILIYISYEKQLDIINKKVKNLFINIS